MISDEMHPYISFQVTGFLWKMCKDASYLLSSLLLLFVYFFGLPSLLTSSIYLVAFYTCLYQFFCNSIAILSVRGVGADMDKFRVGYPTKAYVLHSLLHKHKLQSTTTLKAGSQSDARPCIVLIRETHKYITKKVGGFLDNQMQERNAGKCKDRIRVYPSIVLCFYKRRHEDNATQRIV